eukprot:9491624-Pyramimonas_sp.AAC.1
MLEQSTKIIEQLSPADFSQLCLKTPPEKGHPRLRTWSRFCWLHAFPRGRGRPEEGEGEEEEVEEGGG